MRENHAGNPIATEMRGSQYTNTTESGARNPRKAAEPHAPVETHRLLRYGDPEGRPTPPRAGLPEALAHGVQPGQDEEESDGEAGNGGIGTRGVSEHERGKR